MHSKAVASVLLCALLGACTQPAAGVATEAASAAQGAPAAYLSGPELRQAAVGKTLYSKSHRGIPYTMRLDPDGTGLFVYSGVIRDPLTWDINGDVLCFHSKMGGTECDRVRPSGGGYDLLSSTTGMLNNKYGTEIEPQD